MKISLTVVCLCLGLSFAYKLKCPDASQWAIRARHLCPDPSKYSCLLDDNADVYIENCTRFDRTRRGERYLIRGDFDSHFCSKDFYQPFPYLTNVSSDCIYTKSLCNEEGQVTYNNADPDKDRKCTCDHTRGYDFVTRPSNPCYCVPSEEDCSCYLNPCMTSDLFKIDDRCTNRTKSSVKNNCVPFKNSSKEERRNLTEHKEQTTNTFSERENMSHKAFLALILCIIAVIGLAVIIVIFQDAVDNILNEYFIKVYVINHLKNISGIEGDKCILQCELSKSNFPVQWYKDDESIDITDNNMVKPCEGRHHRLSIKSMSRLHEGQYQLGYGKNVMTKASIRLIVYVIDHLKDISCIEGDECILQCELSKSNFPVHWYKDDESIDITDNNIVKTCEGCHHKLSIKSMSRVYEGQYQLRYGENVMTKASIKYKAEMPVALKQLSEEDKKLYMSIIKSGTEVRRYIRILILGKHKVGKSCLLRRLLDEGIEGVKSTDGIDIVVRRCKIRLSDGEWILDEVTDSKKDALCRIKSTLDGETHVPEIFKPPAQSESELVVPDQADKERTPNPTNQTENENSSKPTSMTSTDTDNDEKLLDEADAHNQPSSSSVNQSSKPSPDIAAPTENNSNVTTGKDNEELINDMLTGIDTVEMPLDQFVECGFWDFAGEKDYYATHQIFLHSYALYVLVADMTEDMKQINKDVNFDSIGGYMDFWFDNIHSHRVKTTTEDTKFDPPVIVVGTGTDKCKDEAELLKNKKDFKDSAYNKETKRQHLRDVLFVSNTEPDKKEFNDLRNAIFEQGQSLQTYNEELPLRWIQLERYFDVMREDGKKNILSLKDVNILSSDFGIKDTNEIKLFLKYQHKVGSIVFFEEIPDYIIVNPKWLANAFRCLISNKFNRKLEVTLEWRKLKENGELEQSLIKKLFEKAPELEFNKYQGHILKIMEAFATIIRPEVSSDDRMQNTSSYYMPCMIESKTSLDSVLEVFHVKTDSCLRTPWLCIEFDFMPLSFFNHILVHFIKKYIMCLKPTNSEQPAIYHGMGVFFIDNAQRIKLLVYFCKNTVAIQLWHWGQITQGTCKELLFDLKELIKNLKMKYEAKQIEYTVKAKCADGNIQDIRGRISCEQLGNMETDGKYMCHQHDELHESKQMYQTWYQEYTEGNPEPDGAPGLQEQQGETEPDGALGIPGSLGQMGFAGEPGPVGINGQSGGRGSPVENSICAIAKTAFAQNRVNIVQGLANADDVADHLHSSGLFTLEMLNTILQENEKEKKNHKILDTLNYRGTKAVKGLHDAFLETGNKELAELLAEYVKVIEMDDNKFSPSDWPPRLDDQIRMKSDPVRRIKDIKSPLVVHEYTSSEVYKMRNKTRGMVFMINNVDFSVKNLEVRAGSDIDAKNLKKIFVDLQFKVIEEKNQGGQEMLNFLKEERNKVNWTEMECMILIIMSHGDTTGIYGADGVIVGLDKMTDIFKDCPGLNEKPKLVFVQACRGELTETVETEGDGGIQNTGGYDGTEVTEEGMKHLNLNSKDETNAVKSENSEKTNKTVHSEADFLIAYATPEGTPAYRNIEVGSWFLNAIVWTFKYHADQQEIQHLLLKVNRLVSQGRNNAGNLTVSKISNTLRKRFYFFPGIYNDPPELLQE